MKLAGWVLTFVGVPLAVVSGLITLVCLAGGPYGIIIAFYLTGPVCLGGIAISALGAFLRNRARRVTQAIDPELRKRRTPMTNHTTPPQGVPEQPIRGAYKPITLEDVQSGQPDPFFQSLENPASRILVGALFAVIFFLANHSSVATPAVLLILLACLLYRMTRRERAITALPLTFSTVRLATLFAGPLGIWKYATALAPETVGPPLEAGTAWVPLFLAAYLFFSPTEQSKSYRVVFWYSVLLLLSGLLPQGGYAAVCALLFYTLFFALLVTLIVDLNPGLNAAGPIAAAPQPARP